MPWLEMGGMVTRPISDDAHWMDDTRTVASLLPQPSEPRIFKTHCTIANLRNLGIMLPVPIPVSSLPTTATAPIAPPPVPLGGQYPKIIYCYRSWVDAGYSAYQFLPGFVHLEPSQLQCDTFVQIMLFAEVSLQDRFQSLVSSRLPSHCLCGLLRVSSFCALVDWIAG